jgi:hypothetical protein
MLPLIVPKAVAAKSSSPGRVQRREPFGLSDKSRFLLVVCLALTIASVFDHLVASWIELPKPPDVTYRRIGPLAGPQVFCAGSSLLQFALSWPEVSEILHQGIESWGTAASTPSEWEVFQNLATNTNLMIIGVDVYDLNEYHLCDTRGNVVPIAQTISDLWQSSTDWQFSKRLLRTAIGHARFRKDPSLCG